MRARTLAAAPTAASLSNKLQLMKEADPPMWAPPPCMQKYAISHVTFQRGAGRRLQRVQRRAPTSCVSNQRKVSEFNGALEEGSRRVKMSARTLAAVFLKTLQSMKLAYASHKTATPPPCMQKYAISHLKFQRGAGRRLQMVRKRAQPHPVCQNSAKCKEFNGAMDWAQKSERVPSNCQTPRCQICCISRSWQIRRC